MANNDWLEIGKRCSAGRRSLWLRVDAEPEALLRASSGFYVVLDYAGVRAFELKAGREGDDAFARVDKTNPQFDDLFEVLLLAAYAATT